MKTLNLIKSSGISAVNYIKKERKKYYEMLDLKNVTDNKDESKIANLFSNFFENAICSLGI